MEALRTLSGAHPFRPACLKAKLELEALDDPGLEGQVLDALEELVWEIDRGFCPRCREGDVREKFPDGSRITACRCVPICHACGEHEAVTVAEKGGLYGAFTWYIDPPDATFVAGEVEEFRSKGRMVDGMVEGILTGNATLITEEGVSILKLRPHPGGWLEFGDEGEDDDERTGR